MKNNNTLVLLDVKDLNAELNRAIFSLAELNIKKMSGLLPGTHEIAMMRKYIARLKTILSQKNNSN